MAHEGDRKGKNILSFFKPKVGIAKSNTPSSSNVGTSIPNEEPPSKSQRVEFDDTNLERDPGLCIPIWQHPINQRDEVRRAYIKAGPYQPNLLEYPRSKLDTTALTLKKEISDVLARYNLNIENMRGQGYDGASNMRGAWNGLQALFLRDSPSAYYVHCFAHRLQLALVVAAENELQDAQAIEIERTVTTAERVTGRGANQIGTLHRAGTTRWSSHFNSICSLIDMYGATIKVLENMVEAGISNSIRGEASGALIAMRSFEFVFILYLMHKIMGITDLLCRALQQKSLDILNAMDLVSTTKALLQTLRVDGFDILLKHVESICTQYDIDLPIMCARYKEVTGRSCQQRDHITVEHHYRFDIFNTIIDLQLAEINNRFNEGAVELLILSSALEPKDDFKSFKIDKIYNLADKFYPADFY
ncbi:General transcription factor 2-related zinc finger protein [Actinidia rufa]|uniref:General transcription factor 2-related zinc finger protein n=1 Tax=Actinidia rufa TaxID=165716 RepID=A0A7J0FI81_9ERIC|nr:General transcription factor 2-related zinc finger protein [Actinidia rufa]